MLSAVLISHTENIKCMGGEILVGPVALWPKEPIFLAQLAHPTALSYRVFVKYARGLNHFKLSNSNAKWLHFKAFRAILV